MSKLVSVSRLSRFWTNAKSYIDTGLSGKATTDHTHTGYANATHAHSYNDLSNKPTIPTTVAQLTDAGNYALKTEIVDVEIATDAEIDALFE